MCDEDVLGARLEENRGIVESLFSDLLDRIETLVRNEWRMKRRIEELEMKVQGYEMKGM